jgi:hypothetical protein
LKNGEVTNLKTNLIGYGVLSAFALVSQIGVYYYVDSNNGFDLDPMYKENILKCSGKSPTIKDVQSENILSAGAVLLAFGTYAGSVLKFTKLRPVSAPTKALKFICILLIKILLLVPGLLVLGLTYWQSSKLDSIVAMLLIAAIPSVYCTFIAFSGLDVYIYTKISGQEQLNALLLKEDDIENASLVERTSTTSNTMS